MARGRFFFLGEIGQAADLKSAERAVDQIRRAVETHPGAPLAEAPIEALRREVFSLRLGLEVLGQIMIEKGIVSEQELARLATVLFAARPEAPATPVAPASGPAPAPAPIKVEKQIRHRKRSEKQDLEQLLAIEEIPKGKDVDTKM